MIYQARWTRLGKAREAAAIRTAQPLNLTHMAVGDGAGNPINLDDVPGMVALRREVYRTNINAVAPVPGFDNQLAVEMVIGPAVGPFVIREVGLFDEAGQLIAVGRFPPTTKPVLDEGSTTDMVIQLTLAVEDAASVQIAVNPLLQIATRTWVQTYFLEAPGGTTGQMLRKTSNADGQVEWFTPEFDDINLVVASVVEKQTLAEDQETVELAIVGTNGAAIYIDGLRKTPGDDYDAIDSATIQLVTPAAGGEVLLAVQNDPGGELSDATEIARGLVRFADETEAGDSDNDQQAIHPKAMAAQQTAHFEARRAGESTAQAAASHEHLLTPLGGLQLLQARLASGAGTAAPLAAEFNLNTLGVSGYYAATADVINGPSGSGPGIVHHFAARPGAATTAKQQYLADTGSVWTRSNSGSGWSAWVRLLSSADYQTTIDGNHISRRMPDGLIEKYGYLAYNNTVKEGRVEVAFPEPFDNACVNATATVHQQPGIYADGALHVVTLTRFRASFYQQMFNGPQWHGGVVGYYWHAVGY